MRALFRRLMPDRISSQLIAVIIGAVILAHFVLALVFLAVRDRGEHNNPAEITGRLAGLVEMLDVTPAGQRDILLAAAMRAHAESGVELAPVAMPAEPAAAHPSAHFLSRALGAKFRVSVVPETPSRLQVELKDGAAVLVRIAQSPPPPPVAGWFLLSLVFTLLCLVLLGTWATLVLTRPLRALAQAAERYSPSAPALALPQEGPREIRTLAEALGSMQSRISQLLQERSNALAAVSHDLRTPITRMRLRAEFLHDEAERDRIVADLDQMDALARSALDHLRNEVRVTSREQLDLASLCQTVADRYIDLGHAVTCDTPTRVMITGNALDLERAIGNLVENACKYATPPHLSLAVQGREAILTIEDCGAGLLQAERLRLLQPFMRGDHARNMDEGGGFGLGLAIAEGIIARHGGVLALEDAVPRGLRVTISLPLR